MAFSQRTLRSVVLMGILDIVVVFMWLLVRGHGVGKVIQKRNGLISVFGYDPFGDVCQEKRQIAFVNVPNSGGAIVRTILYRFGTTRQQLFVLPRRGSDITFTRFVQIMPWLNYGNAFKNRETFDIACNHVEYNKDALLKVLPAGAVYIGIVRHPLSVLGHYVHDHLRSVIPSKDKLSTYLLDPEKYEDLLKENASSNLLAKHFGLPREYMTNITEINNFVQRIDKQFGMILVSEFLDESLILVKRSLCWNMSDILYFRTNWARSAERNATDYRHLDIDARNHHREMAKADYIFYQHFHKKIQDKIFLGGIDFQQELHFFKKTLQSVNKFCGHQLWRTDGQLKVIESPWGPKFNVSRFDCEIMMKNDVELLELVGERQYGDSWNNLRHSSIYYEPMHEHIERNKVQIFQ